MPETPQRYATSREYQVGGDHYQGHAMQPWDIIDEYGLDFWEGNALKYLLRRKPGVARVEDLRKAAHYLERCIERVLEAATIIKPRPDTEERS